MQKKRESVGDVEVEVDDEQQGAYDDTTDVAIAFLFLLFEVPPSARAPFGMYPSERCPSERCPSGKCPSGKCPSGRYPSWKHPFFSVQEHSAGAAEAGSTAKEQYTPNFPCDAQHSY